MKRGVLAWCALALAGVWLNADDSLWLHRGSVSDAERAYDAYRSAFQEAPTYESAWELARICQFCATAIPDRDSRWRRSVLEEGRDAAEIAVKMEPDRVEGHFFASACLGSLAEIVGPLRALASIKEIEREATRAVEIDPGYAMGSPLLALARLYHIAPAIIGVGNAKKAERYYRAAMEYGAAHRTLLRFFAEFLVQHKRAGEALYVIRGGLAIPYDPDNALLEVQEILILGELLRSTGASK